MCRRVTCKDCGRPTFAGCGMHVEQVLGDVAPADRCRCHEKPKRAERPEATAAEGANGWFRKLFTP